MSDIIDINTHVGPSVYTDFEFDPSISNLKSHLEAAGIDEGLVSPLKPPSLDFNEANARLASDLSDISNLHGVGRIDPRRQDAPTHVQEAIKEHGLKGIRLHPWEETYDITSDRVLPVIDEAEALDVPVWIHAGYPGVSHALSVGKVIKSYPDVTFVLTHGAQLDISGLSLTDALLLARETENTVFDPSGVYRRDFIQDLVETAGADRVLFGSNAPYFHPEVEMSRITTNDIDDTTTETILSGGAQLLE